MQRNRWVKLLFGAALTVVVAYMVATHIDKIRANVSERDSVQYWYAGEHLIHRVDAYEVERIRTPPWSLFLFLPLGLAPDAFWGWLLWIAASVASMVVAMRLCWKMFGKDDKLRPVFTTVGYLFVPVLACLEAGQIGFVLLIGIVLFMFYETKRPFIAGAALIFPFAKPHLLVFFWVAFFLWLVARKKFALAGGFICAVAAATIVALICDAHAFQHYRELASASRVGGEFIPTLSGVLRLIFFRQYFKMQFVPLLLGLVWCVWFCVKNVSQWS
ncbi:MAG TPA: glycosyltransferase family 87 protein, partial [Candidatus Bathyarchaeia archaeon]|nr:glycosyltransferase family 87 protein [Candidatus Bathyarchaeia archaeon]